MVESQPPLDVVPELQALVPAHCHAQRLPLADVQVDNAATVENTIQISEVLFLRLQKSIHRSGFAF